MATRLYFRDAPASWGQGKGISQFMDEWPPQTGTLRALLCKALSTNRGGAATTAVINTINSSVTGVAVLLTKTAGATPGIIFVSEPLDQDVTISGSILYNLRAAESNMSANAAINCNLYRLPMVEGDINGQGIDSTARTVECAVTTEGANNFSETPAAGVAFLKGDRIIVHLGFGQSTASMASTFTATFWYDGPTAAASGDSYLEFTETFGFETTTPAGTQLFLTDTAGPTVDDARSEKEMWTSRGGGVVSKATVARSPAAYSSGGMFYGNAIGSGLPDYFPPGTNPLVLRDGDAVVAEQVTEVATTQTPVLDTAANDIGAQSFLVGGSDEFVYMVKVNLTKNGSDAALQHRLAIYSDNGSDRPGSLIKTIEASNTDPQDLSFSLLTTATYNHFLIGTCQEYDEFPLDEGILLTAGTKYWLRLITQVTSGAASIQTRGSDASNDNYANGSRIYSTNGGGAWTQPANEDWAFGVYSGRIMEWYTPSLTAFTLADLVQCNLRYQGSDAATGMAPLAVLDVVDSDGTNPVRWGWGQHNDATDGQITASEVAYSFIMSGDDLAVTDGQRLRLRAYVFGTPQASMTQNDSFTFYYAGTSAAASGDSWIQLSQSVTEFAPATLILSPGFLDHANPGVL